MGDLLTLPVKEQSCFECVNASFTGTGSTFCMLFREVILSEKTAAQDCDGFERE